MEWNVNPPKSADIIRTKVSFYYHYGIYVSDGEVIQFGLPNDPLKKAEQISVLSSNIDEFLNGGELETASFSREEIKKMRTANEIIQIARSRIGEGGYDILHNNCEHFVNECVFGEGRSSFVDSVREKIRKKLSKK